MITPASFDLQTFEINVWRDSELLETLSLEPGSYVIGRSQSCDVVLASAEVSRRHAHVELRDGAWHIEDLGSPNGLFVDGRRVRSTEIEDGSRIAIDPFVLEIRLGERTDPVTHMQGATPQPKAVHMVLLTTHPPVRVPITARITRLGRAHQDPVPLQDPHISRTHALVRRVHGEYLIEDRHSANGTWIRGQRVHTHKLNDGDEIRLGAQLLRFEMA